MTKSTANAVFITSQGIIALSTLAAATDRIPLIPAAILLVVFLPVMFYSLFAVIAD